jgi:hypothetical protein
VTNVGTLIKPENNHPEYLSEINRRNSVQARKQISLFIPEIKGGTLIKLKRRDPDQAPAHIYLNDVTTQHSTINKH